MNAMYHCKSSAKKWGGLPEDYRAVHDFLDQTKATMPDVRHRAILHNALGCFLAEQVFGQHITVDGRDVPVREICERHIIEDLGFIPTVEDMLRCMPMSLSKWMGGSIPALQRSGVSVPRHITDKLGEMR